MVYIDLLLARVSEVGVREVAALDLTKPAFDIPVWRVIIPGLEGPHDHADYCPGIRAMRRGAR
ncbi:MAG: YcaO-like family protein [Pseudomonadota bacterium]